MHKCKRCLKEFNKISHYKDHINRKFPCVLVSNGNILNNDNEKNKNIEINENIEINKSNIISEFINLIDNTETIDTVEINAIEDLNQRLKGERAFMRFQFNQVAKFKVRQEEELDKLFLSINRQISDVDLLVLTHLHIDHTDGLQFFPGKEIILHKHEFEHPVGNLPSTYPSWFKPHLVEFKRELDIFEKAYPITTTGDMLYIPTPGHTPGHSSVLFKTDHFDIIFAGDTSYNQDQLFKNDIAGANASYKKTRETYSRLIKHAGNRKTIYLPSHDAEAGERLKNTLFMIN
jgi:glyoxylase-like metal-dependent hydrolase (beta-lactamase superfamily II)